MNHLVDPSFERMNRLFVLSFENENDKRSCSNCYLPRVEEKDYNIIINGKTFFDLPINNDFKTNKNIRKNSIGQEDDIELVAC